MEEFGHQRIEREEGKQWKTRLKKGSIILQVLTSHVRILSSRARETGKGFIGEGG